MDISFNDVTDGMRKLESNIALRNKIGGSMYWNICNDDCFRMADALYAKGGNKQAIQNLLDRG